jgi:ribonucleotide monophosphatase NagD (HAD superfamily)
MAHVDRYDGFALDSDIAGGARAGFGTVLVLTGRADRPTWR